MHRTARKRSDTPIIAVRRSVRQLLWMAAINLALVIAITGRVYEVF